MVKEEAFGGRITTIGDEDDSERQSYEYVSCYTDVVAYSVWY
jgi:hypothetical protein